VTKGFDSKNYCDSRTYCYITPTFAFAPLEEVCGFSLKSCKLKLNSNKCHCHNVVLTGCMQGTASAK